MSDLDRRVRGVGQHIDIVRLLYFTACKTYDCDHCFQSR